MVLYHKTLFCSVESNPHVESITRHSNDKLKKTSYNQIIKDSFTLINTSNHRDQ